uniref:Uncharacterized protein n=1 Tax=Arundo donax TaxID=35708 RepID=A0A0A9BXU9_ARUDO
MLPQLCPDRFVVPPSWRRMSLRLQAFSSRQHPRMQL